MVDDGVTGKTITVRPTCAKAHYGLCITRDVLFFPIALRAANALMALFLEAGACERIIAGTYFKLEATGAEKKHMSSRSQANEPGSTSFAYSLKPNTKRTRTMCHDCACVLLATASCTTPSTC